MSVTGPEPVGRFLLWIDAVGGYLVCLHDEVLLGQAVPEAGVDIPIQGDLSRRHAKIVREGDRYLLVPFGPVRIGGRSIDGAALLNDGDEVELGGAVAIRFRQPHPLSPTARLEPLSFHRTLPSTDAVVLMADSCVLGPGAQNHVTCRDWTQEVLLFRQGGQFCCRASDAIRIDGKRCSGASVITLNSRITGSDFSLNLEKL
jgi:hypothetical protein